MTQKAKPTRMGYSKKSRLAGLLIGCMLGIGGPTIIAGHNIFSRHKEIKADKITVYAELVKEFCRRTICN